MYKKCNNGNCINHGGQGLQTSASVCPACGGELSADDGGASATKSLIAHGRRGTLLGIFIALVLLAAVLGGVWIYANNDDQSDMGSSDAAHKSTVNREQAVVPKIETQAEAVTQSAKSPSPPPLPPVTERKRHGEIKPVPQAEAERTGLCPSGDTECRSLCPTGRESCIRKYFPDLKPR